METKQVELTVTVRVDSCKTLTDEESVFAAKQTIHDSKYSNSMFWCSVVDIEEASND